MVCRELLATAKEATGGSGPDDDLQQQFNDLTEDVDELKQQVIQLRAEAEGISCANPRVVSLSLHQDGFALLSRVSGLAFGHNLLWHKCSCSSDPSRKMLVPSLLCTSQEELSPTE